MSVEVVLEKLIADVTQQLKNSESKLCIDMRNAAQNGEKRYELKNNTDLQSLKSDDYGRIIETLGSKFSSQGLNFAIGYNRELDNYSLWITWTTLVGPYHDLYLRTIQDKERNQRSDAITYAEKIIADLRNPASALSVKIRTLKYNGRSECLLPLPDCGHSNHYKILFDLGNYEKELQVKFDMFAFGDDYYLCIMWN